MVTTMNVKKKIWYAPAKINWRARSSLMLYIKKSEVFSVTHTQSIGELTLIQICALSSALRNAAFRPTSGERSCISSSFAKPFSSLSDIKTPNLLFPFHFPQFLPICFDFTLSFDLLCLENCFVVYFPSLTAF